MGCIESSPNEIHPKTDFSDKSGIIPEISNNLLSDHFSTKSNQSQSNQRISLLQESDNVLQDAEKREAFIEKGKRFSNSKNFRIFFFEFFLSFFFKFRCGQNLSKSETFSNG